MLRLENISFNYDNSKELVLNNFSLSIEEGTTLAILGASGCGKSTILRIIAGLEKPQKGSVYIKEKEITKTPTEKRNIGFLFQEYALFPHMTVYENINYGLPKGRNQLRVNEIAQLVGVEEFLKRYPHELSGGQRQRVALARAIVYKPEVLLLDEPFSNLDTELREQIRNDIKDILDKTDITTILVTHDKEDADVLADKVLSL